MRFAGARACVLEQVHATPPVETVPIHQASGRILAEDLIADRDYPPLPRSVRDGFAVRSADEPRGLQVIGEVRAGESYAGALAPGQAVEIMTGAPVPSGADAVIMVEHVLRDGDRISADRPVSPGDFINPRGTEARAGSVILPRGVPLGYAAIAAAATIGKSCLTVYRRPRVAVLATGDEVLGIDQSPREFQIRNSNSYSLGAQVQRAGGIPDLLPVAPDEYEAARALIERGLQADLLLLAGGVSAGKYDIVESILAALGAEFYFDRVRIQPGQPLVFGKALGTFFFGLPGNPASTMVTFELFARAAIERLSGVAAPFIPFSYARLQKAFQHKTGLTRFLPALLDETGGLTPLHWSGSSDVPALARANCFLVAEEDRERWEQGDMIRILPK
jgi:molybdopterin molybdotransferase